MHGAVLVYTLDGRRIGEAECVLAAGFNDREAAREVAKQKQRRKKALRKVQEAELRISAREASKMLPTVQPPEVPETKVVKPIFSGRQESKQVDDDERFGRAVSMMRPAKGSLL